MKPSIMGFNIDREVKMETRKLREKTIIAILTILCTATISKATLVNSNSIVQDGIEYYIQTDKSVYNRGESVEILYRVTNLTENSVSLGLGPPWSECYRSIVKDNADNEVWHFPWHYRTLPPMNLVLGAYSSIETERFWIMMNDNGTDIEIDDFPVPNGLYTVTGELLLYNSPYEEGLVFVSIEIIPEPCSLVLLGAGLMGIFLNRKRKD
jgi:hypothetical protein